MTERKSVVLLVEDEEMIAQVQQAYLQNAGYTVLWRDCGDAVIDVVKEYNPDIVLLDIMIPDAQNRDGIALCSEIRAFSDVPIMMISAKVEEFDRLVGFEHGADDYMCKPFSPKEMVMRVQALLRRRQKHHADGGNGDKAPERVADGADNIFVERLHATTPARRRTGAPRSVPPRPRSPRARG